MTKSVTVAFYVEEGTTLEAECAKDVQEYGLDSYKVVEQHGGSGGWPEVEFTGPEDKVDAYERVYTEAM